VLESVPKLLRGFVRGRIETNVAPERRENFVLLFQLEDRWKSAVQFQAPDDAYLLVLAPDGTVVWHGDGGADLAGYDVLKAQIEPLLRKR
jgi:hypothetical protein